MGRRREIWFKQIWRWTPWAVIPVHWKGAAILALVPGSLVVGLNLIPLPPMVFATVLCIGGGFGLWVIYGHTELAD